MYREVAAPSVDPIIVWVQPSRTLRPVGRRIELSSFLRELHADHLRFDRRLTENLHPGFSVLKVEGTIRHPAIGEAWEYSMMLTIRNDKGEEVARQVVGVGALQPDEQRTFTLAVEVFTPEEMKLQRKAGAGR